MTNDIEPKKWVRRGNYLSGKGKYGTVILTESEMRNKLIEIKLTQDNKNETIK